MSIGPDFRAFFEAHPTLELALDKELHVITATDAYLHAVALSRPEVVGRPIFDIFTAHPRGPQSVPVAEFRAVLEQVRAANTSGLLTSPSNTPLSDEHGPRRVGWVHLLTPVRGDRGEFDGILLHAEEMVDAALPEIAVAPEQLHTVIDLVPALVGFVGPDLRYRLVNRGYEEWFRRPRGEIIGHTIAELVGPQVYAELEPLVNRALAGERVSYEMHVPYPEGERVISCVYLPQKTATGALLGILIFVMDVTERERTQAAVRQRNERLRILSDVVVELLSARDPVQTVQRLFRRVAPSLGIDAYLNFIVSPTGDRLRLLSSAGVPDEQLGRFAELEFGAAVCGHVALLRASYVAARVQTTTDPALQSVRDLGLHAYACNPLVADDTLIGTLSFGSRTREEFDEEDLQFMRLLSQHVAVALGRLRAEQALSEAKAELERTVERRTASLQETIAELERFSYSITHDMRAPLRAMQSFALILQEEASQHLDDRERDYLRRIVTSAHRMDRLIQDVLAYSKVLRSELQLTPVEPRPLIEGILNSYPDLHAPGTRVELIGEFPRVLGNEAALTQCFSNLLTNAIKFVRPGVPPHVRLWAERRGEHIRIWCEDNGIGIDPVYRERIFGLFQRLDRAYEGTGVGLTIVQKAAERMGGSVGVESTPGAGSRFWLELRAAPAS